MLWITLKILLSFLCFYQGACTTVVKILVNCKKIICNWVDVGRMKSEFQSFTCPQGPFSFYYSIYKTCNICLFIFYVLLGRPLYFYCYTSSSQHCSFFSRQSFLYRIADAEFFSFNFLVSLQVLHNNSEKIAPRSREMFVTINFNIWSNSSYVIHVYNCNFCQSNNMH
jgi:hypothetical protein